VKHPLTIRGDSVGNSSLRMCVLMIKRFAQFCLVAAMLGAPAGAALAADSAFFSKVGGKWRGPGEIVAGKYKGTKFNCDFDGSMPAAKDGMTLDGSCRVGVFTQKMSATVKQAGRSYQGRFLDGAAGEGLDVIAGNVTSDKAVLTLKRKQLDGAMLARLANDNQMNVTVSVMVGDELVPVIGMKLNRVDGTKVGSIK